MKKNYSKPTLQVIQMDANQILCTSTRVTSA